MYLNLCNLSSTSLIIEPPLAVYWFQDMFATLFRNWYRSCFKCYPLIAVLLENKAKPLYIPKSTGTSLVSAGIEKVGANFCKKLVAVLYLGGSLSLIGNLLCDQLVKVQSHGSLLLMDKISRKMLRKFLKFKAPLYKVPACLFCEDARKNKGMLENVKPMNNKYNYDLSYLKTLSQEMLIGRFVYGFTTFSKLTFYSNNYSNKTSGTENCHLQQYMFHLLYGGGF